MNSDEELWLPRRGLRSDADVQLFCIPHAGGGTASYHGWTTDISPTIDVIPILLPGRERRFAEPANNDLKTTVKNIADALTSCVRAPFAIFGHSMGALIGFELCRELRRRTHPLPVVLIVAAFRAPHLPATSTPLHKLPDSEFVEAIQKRFRGIPDEVANNAELLQLFLPTLRADITSIENYQYEDESPLSCPLLALGGTEDTQVAPAELAAWRRHTTGEFVQKMIPGGHFFVTERRSETIRLVERELLRRVPQS